MNNNDIRDKIVGKYCDSLKDKNPTPLDVYKAARFGWNARDAEVSDLIEYGEKCCLSWNETLDEVEAKIASIRDILHSIRSMGHWDVRPCANDVSCIPCSASAAADEALNIIREVKK